MKEIPLDAFFHFWNIDKFRFSREFNALKEAAESEYWIELLSAGDYLDKKMAASMLEDISEIMKLLTASVKTAKENAKDSEQENRE